MPNSTQNKTPEFEFKHRIVGATILIVLTISFLPMILDGNRQELTAKSLNESSSGNNLQSSEKKQVFVSTIRPVVKPTETKKSQQTAVEAVLDESPANQEEDVIEGGKISVAELSIDKPDSTQKPKSAELEQSVGEKPAPTPSASTTITRDGSVEGEWIIQIGLYGKRENTNRTLAKLKKEGLRGSVSQILYQGKEVDRVWIGPYPTEKAADAVAKKYQKQSGEKVLVKKR